MYSCRSKSVAEILEHVAGMLDNQQITAMQSCESAWPVCVVTQACCWDVR